MEIKRVCLIDCRLAPVFRDMGLEVLAPKLEPGVVDLPYLLDKAGFEPDLVFQQERLGPRVLLQGLPEISCPKIFWSIDTHLNTYWHGIYGRLFDAVMTTQRRLAGELKNMGTARVLWLPWYGQVAKYVPWSKREHKVGFVGRVTEQRVSRKWLLEFLNGETQALHRQDVPENKLAEVYQTVRMVPNESILGEINFRLFEAASCGCLVLNPALGMDLEALFAPGEEILTYEHVLELKDLLQYYTGNPKQAESMAVAALERVQREHLPEHRVGSILETAKGLSRGSLRGTAATAAWWLTQLGLWESGLFPGEPAKIAAGLMSVEPSPEVLAGLLRLWVESGHNDPALGLMVSVTDQDHLARSLDLNMTASLCSLKLNRYNLAVRFWYRHVRNSPKAKSVKPDGPTGLYTLWADELARNGRVMRSGLGFRPEFHVPQSAVECLFAAQSLKPGDVAVTKKLDSLLNKVKGAEFLRLGLLSDLSLRDRDNWRTGLELGLVNLRCFRLEQGVSELLLALDLARKQGEQARLLSVIEAKDPGGLVRNRIFEFSAQH